ncbi:unnamed protein product [Owenia fusiformis]|uniref:Uncharacterized protein n=1 Tax=Owenia fusiformis TaxID=6347 RepID=A0A8J1XX82_OWEFU|nr:unnamed protein product [Owenia fusiformis]
MSVTSDPYCTARHMSLPTTESGESNLSRPQLKAGKTNFDGSEMVLSHQELYVKQLEFEMDDTLPLEKSTPSFSPMKGLSPFKPLLPPLKLTQIPKFQRSVSKLPDAGDLTMKPFLKPVKPERTDHDLDPIQISGYKTENPKVVYKGQIDPRSTEEGPMAREILMGTHGREPTNLAFEKAVPDYGEKASTHQKVLTSRASQDFSHSQCLTPKKMKQTRKYDHSMPSYDPVGQTYKTGVVSRAQNTTPQCQVPTPAPAPHENDMLLGAYGGELLKRTLQSPLLSSSDKRPQSLTYYNSQYVKTSDLPRGLQSYQHMPQPENTPFRQFSELKRSDDEALYRPSKSPIPYQIPAFDMSDVLSLSGIPTQSTDYSASGREPYALPKRVDDPYDSYSETRSWVEAHMPRYNRDFTFWHANLRAWVH